MSREPKPDFAALRNERDTAITEIVRALAAQMGADPDKITFHSCDLGGCYCNCPEGPCEHEFGGWRAFDDGCGGETFCKLCGLGAMSHSLRHAP